VSPGTDNGRKTSLSRQEAQSAGSDVRRFALPAVALALALTATLALWQSRLESPSNDGALGTKSATATAIALGTAGGANGSREPDDGSTGDAPAGDGPSAAGDAGVAPRSIGDEASESTEEGTIGEAFSYGGATATPVPLLARTALLPLVVAADAGAIGRALEAAERAASSGTVGESGGGPGSLGRGAAREESGPGEGEGAAPVIASPQTGPGQGPATGADPARVAALAGLPPGVPAWQRELLAERVGFGRGATGGLGGRIVRVTTLDDEDDGSIRAAMAVPGPRWVVFDVSGVIRLDGMLRVPSDTTIDGRGTYIAFQGSGLDIRGVSNVIVSHVVLEAGEGDAISVRARASTVWLNHLTLRDFSDGLVDVTREATDVTVSWCRFEDHEKVMLVGGDGEMPQDAVIRVTMHHNLFDRTGQRQPRLRFGRVHAFNNVLDRWRSIGMAANYGGELLVERNVFVAGERAEEAVRAGADEDAPGRVKTTGNQLLERDGAGGWRPATAEEVAGRFETRHPERVFDAAAAYPYSAAPADMRLLDRVRAAAGWQPAEAPPGGADAAD
jgi:pectate lyase